MADLCILCIFKPIQTYKAQNMGMSILINFIIPIINPENISKMKNTINIVKTFKKIDDTFPRK